MDSASSSKEPINLTVHLSIGARKIVSEEEAQMLIKWAWEEMEKKKGEGYNLFRFPKLGVCLVRDGNEMVLMTLREQSRALHKKE